MLINKIKLWENNEEVTLISYILDNSPEIKIKRRPTILICPGGGYLMTSDREAEPIAMKFAGEGYNTFVIRYTTHYNKQNIDFNNLPKGNENSKYPQPLFDLGKAILTIRKNADEWSVDTNKLFVCGFSAGGHLAASLGVHWDSDLLKDKFKVESELFKPNGLILGYPVLDYNLMEELKLEIDDPGLNEFWGISNNALFGEPNPSKDYLKELSPVNYVSKNTPPTFMWHTANDGLVPVGNSINFASELSKKGVPYELHIFEDGVHGLSLCNEVTANEAAHINKNAEVWFGMVLTWLKKYTTA